MSETRSRIRTRPFGGDGGAPFGRQIIKEIGLRTNSRVDQIRINGKAYGGDGGADRGSITLLDDEYINKVEIRSGNSVDYVGFSTNYGNVIGGGGGGGVLTVLENIRVLAIGGRCGRRIDRLDIMYVENYEPSVVAGKNVGFIVGFVPQFTKMECFESVEGKTLEVYERITKFMMKSSFSASVEGEYYVKVVASTGIQVENAELTTVRREISYALRREKRETLEVKEGYVGILLVHGNLMVGAGDGGAWVYPTGVLSYAVKRINDISGVLGHYDLTGELYVQMPQLERYKEVRNGITYYRKREA